MATVRAYTTIEQSRKLAKILPLESADMYYILMPDCVYNHFPLTGRKTELADDTDIPCWSLAALLEQLPYEVCDDDGNSSYLQISKEDDVYQLVYEDPCWEFESIKTDRYEHFVDACVAMIEKLNELNLL